jgi:ketosteroid isomerase-like protein
MKTKMFLVLVLLLCALSLVIGCAEGVDVGAEKENIRAMITEGFDAVANQDWETLSGLISEDWVFFTHLGTKWNLEEMQGWFKDHISDHRISISNVSIEVSMDGSMAWAKFDEDTEFKFDGNPGQGNAIFTAIFEKGSAGWKMVHLHRTATAPPAQSSE